MRLIKNIDFGKIVVVFSTVFAFLFSFIFSSQNTFYIYQDILYIPIILSCIWYYKKGFIYSLVIIALQLLQSILYIKEAPPYELERVMLFILAAFITQILADRIKKQQITLNRVYKDLHDENIRFKKAQAIADLGIWEMDLKTGKTVWSDELFRMFGFEPGSFEPSLNKRIEFTYEEDKKLVFESIKNSTSGNNEFKIENRIVKKDGTVRWVISTGYVKCDEQNRSEKFIGTLMDITDRKLSESAIAAEREKFMITIQSIGDGVISTDINGNIDILNEVAEKLTGWKQEEAAGMPFSDVFNIINEYTRLKCENPVEKVLEHGLIIGLANHTALISKQGVERSIADSAAPIRDNFGKINGVVLVFRDITEEKRRRDEIKYISYHDSLTGLFNRRYLEEEIVKIDTESNLPISIIMGDVNGLKLTNDTFGHTAGDILLKKATEAIQRACRMNDIAIRWGGDEFVILLQKTTGKEAEDIVKNIKNICSEMKVDSIDVSVSFGCCTKEKTEDEIRVVLKNAEDRMYENKIIETESMRGNLITTIINTLHEKSPMEELHSKRVSSICQDIGRAIDVSDKEINKLKVIGLLHDIGKIAINEAVLNEPSKLTDRGWDEIKRHPDIGYRILCSSREMSELAEYVLAHHERYDGTGYPRGLKGEDIPLLSRIVAVADSYDAMTSNRNYRSALDKNNVVEEFIKNKGLQFDPVITDVFLNKVMPSYEQT